MARKKTETVPARDGCVVDTFTLAGILNVFVGEWEKTRPKSDGRRHNGSHTGTRPYRAVEWLAAESGVSEYTIRNVMNTWQPQVDLGVADALVAAVGHPEAFHDGTLEVKGCCGGSTRPDV